RMSAARRTDHFPAAPPCRPTSRRWDPAVGPRYRPQRLPAPTRCYRWPEPRELRRRPPGANFCSRSVSARSTHPRKTEPSPLFADPAQFAGGGMIRTVIGGGPIVDHLVAIDGDLDQAADAAVGFLVGAAPGHHLVEPVAVALAVADQR